jgi:hypothetical protein
VRSPGKARAAIRYLKSSLEPAIREALLRLRRVGVRLLIRINIVRTQALEFGRDGPLLYGPVPLLELEEKFSLLR